MTPFGAVGSGLLNKFASKKLERGRLAYELKGTHTYNCRRATTRYRGKRSFDRENTRSGQAEEYAERIRCCEGERFDGARTPKKLVHL